MSEWTATVLVSKVSAEVGALMCGLDEAVSAAPRMHWSLAHSCNWEIRINVADDARFAPLNSADHQAGRQVIRYPATEHRDFAFRVVVIQADSLRQVLIDAVDFWLENVGVESATPRLRLVVPA